MSRGKSVTVFMAMPLRAHLRTEGGDFQLAVREMPPLWTAIEGLPVSHHIRMALVRVARDKGWRDLHVGSDWAVIYKIDDETVRLERTGTHADLFNELAPQMSLKRSVSSAI